MRQDKDRSGKWLIDHHGDSILRLGNVTGFIAWRPAQPEQVAPRRLPDGLLEVTFPDRSEPDPFLIEIETYADRSIANQVFEDILITRLERGVVPDVVTVVLRPKGQVQVESRVDETSRHGSVNLGSSWRVVELWKLNADDLLAANDVGLIPWVPLTRFSGPPEQILRQCRERIDKQAKPQEHDALLTVTSLLSTLVLHDETLLEIFGGLKTMIESPILDKLGEIWTRQDRQSAVIDVLLERFASVPEDLAQSIRSIEDMPQLKALHRYAVSCPDMDSFRVRLASKRGAEQT